ncbi:MAG: type II toxin-antitoxin system HicA family toxin [Planctomycetota bacterium]
MPTLSGRELAKVLRKIGYEFDHQKGSHMILRQVLPPFRRITVPDHKTVAKGTLRDIIHQVGLTLQEFRDLL